MNDAVDVRMVHTMPRAQDYRTAATSIENSMESIATMARILDLHRDDFGFSGTSIADTVQRGIIAGATNAGRAGASCAQLVGELHRRAALCDQYTADLTDYRSRVATWNQDLEDWEASSSRGGSARHPGSRPHRPPRPFEGALPG